MSLFPSRDPSASATRYAAVTPHDANDFGNARGLYVGVTGDVSVVDWNGNAVPFKAVPAGTILPVACKRVNATGTTATDIVALF